jgi:phosphoribosylanthranilate isomerase
MQKGIHVKVCGLTREIDVEAALHLGADAFGFIAYPGSPRAVSLQRAGGLSAPVPPEQRVIVDVEPELETIRAFQEAGFRHFQIHASLQSIESKLAGWSKLVGREHLWIAPRLPKGAKLPEVIPQDAVTVLIDTYSEEKAGGTGATGDWGGFAQLQNAYPETTFILAGGLTPHNVAAALKESEARFVDVNSGVESAPGVKDLAKLAAFFKALQ